MLLRLMMLRLLLSVLILVPSVAGANHDGQEEACHAATVIFCENFEGRATGTTDLTRPTYKNRGWINQSGHQVTTDPNAIREGSKGFRVVYPEGANTGLGFLIGQYANAAGAATGSTDVYFREYVKWSSNFTFSSVSNKRAKLGRFSGQDDHIFQRTGGGDAMNITHGITPSWWDQGAGPNQADAYLLYKNMGGTPNFQLNQWYCVETHIRNNSAIGVSDGVVEAWINGTQVMSYTGLNIDRDGVSTGRQYGNVWIDGYRNCEVGTQVVGSGNCVDQGSANYHPLMYRYHDALIVSTARVGCLGSAPPPVDTIPPSTPGTPTAGSATSSSIPLSWTASSDAGGVAGYAVERSPAGCASFAHIATSPTASYLVTGLTANTTYCFRVRAQDYAGNYSGHSGSVSATTAAAAAASAISITSTGLFAISGTPTFLLGASYMDAQNYRTSDIDVLAAAGFNNIRTFANYAEDTYGGARSVCTADGSLNTTRRDQLQALIDYAQTKSMTVTLIIMSEQTDALIPVDANRQTCVTNIINAYKAEPLVMFDLNNEHTVPGNTWINTPTEYAVYHAVAKAACSTCIIFASSTAPDSHPQDSSASVVASYFSGMLAAGVDVVAFHDNRSSNWATITGARVTAIRNYLASQSRAYVPVFFTEPCRWNYASECNLAASSYFQAAADAKAAGAAGWVWHHGYFDFSTQSLFQQLNPTESTVYQGLSAALAGGSGDVPVPLVTYDFAGTFADLFTGGYTSHDTPNQTGGKLRANATGTESMAQYTGTQTALTSLFTCTTANAGPPPSASWTTFSGNGLKVLSNQCGQDGVSTLTVNDAAAWATDFTDDQVVQATLAALPTSGATDYAYLFVRAQASTGGYDNVYELEIDRSSGSWRKRLYKVSGGAYTQIGSTDTTTVSAGAVFKLTAVGSTITAYQDGAVIATGADSTFATGGYIGIGSYRPVVATTVRWTNIAGGNYSAGGTFATPARQGASIEISTANGASPQYGRVMVRLQDSPTYSGYDCRFSRNATPTASIVRKDNGNPVTLTSSSAVTWSATDTVGCYADGSRISMERNGVEILSVTDATHPTGDIGLYLGTAGSPLADFELDNLTIYEYGTPAPACTPTLESVTPSTTGATITWTAGCTPTTFRVETAAGSVLVPIASVPGGVYSRTWTITDGGYACVHVLDASAVENTAYICVAITASVQDTAVPVLSGSYPTGTLPAGTTTTAFGWVTDEVAFCRWGTTDAAYADLANTTGSSPSLSHTGTLTGLTNGSSTTVYRQCQDTSPSANTTTASNTQVVTVAASTADVTNPSQVANVVVAPLSATQVAVQWDAPTDNVEVSSVTLYACVGDGCTDYTARLSIPTPTVRVILSGLPPLSVVRVYLEAVDSSGNIGTASSVAEATTLNEVDTVPPSDPTTLTVTAYPRVAVLSWAAGTDNVGIAYTVVEICTGAACTSFQLTGSSPTTSYTIQGLTPLTAYRTRIKFVDRAGLVSANYSSRVGFTTPADTNRVITQPRPTAATRLPRN